MYLAKRKLNLIIRNVKTERTYSTDRNKNRLKSNHYDNNRFRTQPIRRNPNYRYPKHRRIVRSLLGNHFRIVYRGLPLFLLLWNILHFNRR
jgi:uncharacterized membrane protein YfhO